MQRILVTGATGNVGRQVVAQLSGARALVRAVARRPETATLPREVEVMRGDLTAPESLDRCLEGVDTVFLVWVAPPDTVSAAVERIAHRVRRVVFLSNMTVRDGSQEQNYPVTALHAQIERLIEASGMRWTFLRPGAFASNARIWWAPQIRAGDVVRWPYGEAVTSPIHESDIAEVAVRALLDDQHAGAKYILTGPESLSQRGQIRMIGEAIGRPLRFDEIPPETARREMGRTFPLAIVDMLMDVWPTTIRKPAPVTDTVAEVTGHPARTFGDWAADHAADFRMCEPANP